MKRVMRFIVMLALVLMVGFALPSQVYASTASFPLDKIIFGGDFTLSSGNTFDGSLVVLGGKVVIEKDAAVDGDLVLMGGSVSLDGIINGNLVTFGGDVSMGATSVVVGDYTSFGGSIHRDNGSQIQGQVTQDGENSMELNLPHQNFLSMLDRGLDPFWDFSQFLARTLAMAALALIVVLVAPKTTDVVAETSISNPVVTGGIGLLTIILAPFAVILLAITILLIPAAIIGIILLAAASVFGYIAIGLEVGKRLAALMKVNWSAPVSAGLGTFVMGLIVGLINFIPCVGWILGAVIGMVGLGSALLTRFGTLPYAGSGSSRPSAAPSQNAPVVDVIPEPAQPATLAGSVTPEQGRSENSEQ